MLFNKDVVKVGIGCCFFGSCLDLKMYCYMLEVFFFSYNIVVFQGMLFYIEEGYFKFGCNVVWMFFDYYKLNLLVLFIKKNILKFLFQRKELNGDGK